MECFERKRNGFQRNGILYISPAWNAADFNRVESIAF